MVRLLKTTVVAWLILVVLVSAGCAGRDVATEEAAQQTPRGYDASTALDQAPKESYGGGGDGATVDEVAPEADRSLGVGSMPAEPMIIRNAALELRVEDIDAAVEKVRLGWLSGGEVSYVNASGAYRLYRLDHRATIGAPRGIRIETPASDYTGAARRYWLNYRFAPWNTGYPWLQNGLQIDVSQNSYSSDGAIQLDMTPYSYDEASGTSWTSDNCDKRDGALVVPAPVDYLSWTEAIRRIASHPDLRAARRGLWLSGRMSATAQYGLTALGWTFHAAPRPSEGH